MRIPRIFTSGPLRAGVSATLDERASHHILRVLRLRQEGKLSLFNELGEEYEATLTGTRNERAVVMTRNRMYRTTESRLNLVLCQGIARHERMDFAIQKSVELGVSTIAPLWMERCQVRLRGTRLAKRMQHWHGVIVSACEQCGRTRIPELLEPQDLSSWLASDRTAATRFILDPQGSAVIPDAVDAKYPIVLLAGPEGGFCQSERESAAHAGYLSLCLGPRVLRTETASLAAIAAMQAMWGDFRWPPG
jgi:16S rRNA (uracil1498-N3)-methyltransferase